MSSSRTTNLNLHAWNADDPVRRDEFNENFAAIDAAIAANTAAIAAAGGVRMIAGYYAGDGNASQFIDLGVTPKAVLAVGGGMKFNMGSTVNYSAFSTDETSVYSLRLAEGGFYAAYYGDQRLNQSGTRYFYAAWY